MNNVRKVFDRMAGRASTWMGHPLAFFLASSIVIIWAISGPLFGFSDTWELIINTSTTIITFLMVFLLQNSQNRDAKALHVKLDALIYAISKADNQMIAAEELGAEELAEAAKKYQALVNCAEKLNFDK